MELFGQQEKYQISDSDYANTTVEMADGMRSSGKIYVVVGALLIVLFGVGIYLYRTDKKISALEKELNERKNS